MNRLFPLFVQPVTDLFINGHSAPFNLVVGISETAGYSVKSLIIKYVKIYGIIEYLVLITKGIPVSFSAVLGVYIVTGFFLIIIALFKAMVGGDLSYLGTAGGTVVVLENFPAFISTCGTAISVSDLCDPVIMSGLLLLKLFMIGIMDIAGLDGPLGIVVNLYTDDLGAGNLSDFQDTQFLFR